MARLPLELLGYVFDMIAEDDPRALYRARRTCKRWKGAIEHAPERWKRACVKRNLNFSAQQRTDGGLQGVGWMRWFASQSQLLTRWEEPASPYSTSDTNAVAGGALRVKIAANGLVFTGHLDGTVRARLLNDLDVVTVGNSRGTAAAGVNGGSRTAATPEEPPHPFVGAVVSLTFQPGVNGIVWTGCMDQTITAWQPALLQQQQPSLTPIKKLLGHEGGVITMANEAEWVSKSFISALTCSALNGACALCAIVRTHTKCAATVLSARIRHCILRILYQLSVEV